MYPFWLQTERHNPGSEYGSQGIPGSLKPPLLEQSILNHGAQPQLGLSRNGGSIWHGVEPPKIVSVNWEVGLEGPSSLYHEDLKTQDKVFPIVGLFHYGVHSNW